MKQTIGIRFSRYGQVLACLYDAEGDAPLTVGESAMVMTERGLNCGQVVWQRPWQEELEQSLRAANAAVQSMGGAESEEEFYERYKNLIDGIYECNFCGFCYTQLTDVQQEVNGLLRADHTCKFDADRVRAITEGKNR